MAGGCTSPSGCLYKFTFHKYFTAFINFLIFANLVTLTIQANNPTPAVDDICWYVDILFNSFFTIEMFLKMACLGIWRKGPAYFAESWNRLDFLIVALSWATFKPTVPSNQVTSAGGGSGSLKALRAIRAVRALRAFRALSFLKNVNVILAAVSSSFGMMVPIFLLSFFFIALFGVAGVQLFAGRMHKRCVTGIENVPECTGVNVTNFTLTAAGAGILAANRSLNGNATTDAFPFSTERFGLPACHVAAQEALNRSLVAIEDPEALCCDPTRDDPGCYVCPPGESCVAIMGNPAWGFSNFDNFAYSFLVTFQVTSLEGWTGILYNVLDSGSNAFLTITYFLCLIFFMVFILLNFFVAVLSAAYGTAREASDDAEIKAEIKAQRKKEGRDKRQHEKEQKEQKAAAAESTGGSSSTVVPVDAVGAVESPDAEEPFQARRRSIAFHPKLPGSADHTEVTKSGEDGDGEEGDDEVTHSKTLLRVFAFCGQVNACWKKRAAGRGPKPFYRIVMHPAFDGFIMLCIFINTITLAMSHFDPIYNGMAPWKKDGLEVCEYVFNFIFLVEMILKLIGLTPIRYCSNFSNLFDGFIVVTGTTNMVYSLMGASENSSLSMLRAFRLLRIVRLLNMLVEVQKLVNTVFGSLWPIMNLLLLIGFSMYIFAIIGSMIFSGTFREDVVGRQNFNGVGASMMSLFVVLSGENWVDIWHEGMAADLALGVVFFIIYFIWMTYIMLNLFVAVILENFETIEEEKYVQQQTDHFDKMWTTLDQHRLTRAASRLVWLARNADSKHPSMTNRLPVSDLKALLYEIQRAYGFAPVVPPEYEVALAARLDPKSKGYIEWEEFALYLEMWSKGLPAKYRHITLRAKSTRNISRTFTRRRVATNDPTDAGQNTVFRRICTWLRPKKAEKRSALRAANTRLRAVGGFNSDGGTSETTRAKIPGARVSPPASSSSSGGHMGSILGPADGPRGTSPSTTPYSSHTAGARSSGGTKQSAEPRAASLPGQVQGTSEHGDASETKHAASAGSSTGQKVEEASNTLGVGKEQKEESLDTQASSAAAIEPNASLTVAVETKDDGSSIAAGVVGGAAGGGAGAGGVGGGAAGDVVGGIAANPAVPVKRRSRASNPQMGEEIRGMLSVFPDAGSGPDPDADSGNDSESGVGTGDESKTGAVGGEERDHVGASLEDPTATKARSASTERRERRKKSGYMLNKAALTNRRLTFGGTMTKESPWERLRKKRHLLLIMARGDDMQNKTNDFRKQHIPFRKRSCFIFTEYNFIRRWSRKIARNQRFDQLILVCILVSALLLAMESPFYPRPSLSVFSKWCDYSFFVIFTIEAVAKSIAMNFVWGKRAYLKDNWNRLDFSVLVVTSPVLLVILSGTSVVRVLRIARTLRPLRTLNRLPGLKNIINSIFASMPRILYVALFSAVIFLIFGILGVSLFAGKFYRCNDPNCGPIGGLAACPRGKLVNYTDIAGVAKASCCAQDYCVGYFRNPDAGGMAIPRVWDNPRYSFDSVTEAVRSLFECATTEGFLDVMYSMADMTEIGLQPVYMHSGGFQLYMIGFILIGSFFIIQLFIGVTIESYNQSSGMAFTTIEQHQWKVMTKEIDELEFQEYVPKKPPQRWRYPFYVIAVHPIFDYSIILCIVLNTLFMMSEHYPDIVLSEEGVDLRFYDVWLVVVDHGNNIFLGIFTFEMVIKLLGLGLCQYLADSWNVFDGGVVLVSWITKYVGNVGSFASIARIFRLFRLIRVFKKAKSIRTLIQTFLASLPSMGYIALLMFLLYFVFAVIGVQLFSTVRYGNAITHHNNFQHWSMAMLLLFRASTGEDWQVMAHDLERVLPACTESYSNHSVTFFTDHNSDNIPDDSIVYHFDNVDGGLEYSDCGVTLLPSLYFFFFYLMGSYLLMNLFVAVILDKFVNCLGDLDEVISQKNLHEYLAAWKSFQDELNMEHNEYMPLIKLKGFFQHFRRLHGSAHHRFGTKVGDDASSIEVNAMAAMDSLDFKEIQHTVYEGLDKGDAELAKEQAKMEMQEAWTQTAAGRAAAAATAAASIRKLEKQKGYCQWFRGGGKSGSSKRGARVAPKGSPKGGRKLTLIGLIQRRGARREVQYQQLLKLMAIRVAGLKSMGFQYQLREERRLLRRREKIAAMMITSMALTRLRKKAQANLAQEPGQNRQRSNSVLLSLKGGQLRSLDSMDYRERPEDVGNRDEEDDDDDEDDDEDAGINIVGGMFPKQSPASKDMNGRNVLPPVSKSMAKDGTADSETSDSSDEDVHVKLQPTMRTPKGALGDVAPPFSAPRFGAGDDGDQAGRGKGDGDE